MRKMFSEYYPLTASELKNLWSSCIFVLDANVLLNAYRYSSDTVDELFSILEHESVSTRLWIPHQAAAEYQRNRLAVIDEQRTVYGKIRDEIQKTFRTLRGNLNQLARHPLISISKIVEQLDSNSDEIENLLAAWESNHPDHMACDHLRTRWTSLLDGKVGNPFDHSRLKEIFQEGKARYENKTPPGYLDGNKSENRQYGDLILWFQIVEKSRQEQKPVILVTDDGKDDWWWIHHGKTIGPRPELLREFNEKTQQQVHMYRSAQFMRFAQKYLGKDIDQNAISEIESIGSEQDARFSPFLVPLSGDLRHEDDPVLARLLSERANLMRELRFMTDELARMASYIESPGRYSPEFMNSEDGRALQALYRDTRYRREELQDRVQSLSKEIGEYRIRKNVEINARRIREHGRITARQNEMIREILINFARIPSYVDVLNMRTADIETIVFNLVERLKGADRADLLDFLVECGVIEMGTHRLLWPEIIESILITDREQIETWYVTPHLDHLES